MSLLEFPDEIIIEIVCHCAFDSAICKILISCKRINRLKETIKAKVFNLYQNAYKFPYKAFFELLALRLKRVEMEIEVKLIKFRDNIYKIEFEIGTLVNLHFPPKVKCKKTIRTRNNRVIKKKIVTYCKNELPLIAMRNSGIMLALKFPGLSQEQIQQLKVIGTFAFYDTSISYDVIKFHFEPYL